MYQNEPNYPYIRVERARLRRWLLTNIDVQWNMHATKFFHDENGAEVHFKDGSIAKGTFLMGCDGANSKSITCGSEYLKTFLLIWPY